VQLVVGPGPRDERQAGHDDRQTAREAEHGAHHARRRDLKREHGGEFRIAVEPAERQHDRDIKRDRDQHLERNERLQADHLGDRVDRQQAVDRVGQEARGAVAREKRDEDAQDRRERLADLADHVPGKDHGRMPPMRGRQMPGPSSPARSGLERVTESRHRQRAVVAALRLMTSVPDAFEPRFQRVTCIRYRQLPIRGNAAPDPEQGAALVPYMPCSGQD
jgi:hypothetical protein